MLEQTKTLYRPSNKEWIVESSGKKFTFSSIEDAASFLELKGIKSDEIDMALTSMSANNDNCAEFGMKGFFTLSFKKDISSNEQ